MLYVGRLVAGFGVGAASMLTPLYVSAAVLDTGRQLREGFRSARMLHVLFVVV